MDRHHRPGDGGTMSSSGGGGGSMYLYGPSVSPPKTGAGGDEGVPPKSSATSAGIPISEEEAKKVKTLTVTDLDLKALDNAIRHWSLRYECTWGLHKRPVYRRAQEFVMALTFDRPVQKDDELYFIVSADEDSITPKKNLRAKFKVTEGEGEDRGNTSGQSEDWTAVVEKPEGSAEVKVKVNIPADCAVGYWHLKVLSKQRHGKDSYVYVCPQSLIILFNPWSARDQVHFTLEKQLLDEYVLSDEGVVFMGTSDTPRTRSWFYGQFEDEIVDICISLLKKAFNGKMTRDMGDPVLVARALSRIVNSIDDNGVLIGNWTGDYKGGTHPVMWTSSLPILRQFHEKQEPVKFGQCWVFSHTLTTVCRALGLPCRSVTNFNSAHDTDSTCTVDLFLDKDGDVMESAGNDSIWNFHVWNEVWILRPDLRGDLYKDGFDGWHVIDATPQESSVGMMQCGPCPVGAVRRGEISVGYDTAFVFSEVNAELVHWTQTEDGDFDASAVIKDKVGAKISSLLPESMKPEGIPPEKIVRMDLTHTYKPEEGSEEEREVVRRAVRYCRYGSRLYKQCSDLTVSFEPMPDTLVGKEVKLTSRVTNVSKEDKEVLVTMAARTTSYWDIRFNSHLLAKETLPKKTLKPGDSETFQLKLSAEQYAVLCDKMWSLHGFACARDLAVNMPYTAEQLFSLDPPQLRVEGPESARSGETVKMTMTLTNPFTVPLTCCYLQLVGTLQVSPQDPLPWEASFGNYMVMMGRDFQVDPLAEMKVSVLLLASWAPEDERKVKKMQICFDSRELGLINSSYSLKKRE